MDDETYKTEAETVRDLARASMFIQSIEGHPASIVPQGYHVQSLEQYLPAPLRIKATVPLATLDGFIAYVEKFMDNGTAIFAHPDTGVVTAVLDYHEPSEGDINGSRWCSHVAKFAPAQTVEWKRWMEKDNRWMEQREFAEFIENNVEDIVKPPGAEMLEVAKTLESKTSVEFKSGVRLEDGSYSLAFSSEAASKAGVNGTLSIPGQFELALTPFIGGLAYPVVARFRHKITDNKLTLRYQLVNPHKVLEAAIKTAAETVATGTGIKPFIGSAPQ